LARTASWRELAIVVLGFGAVTVALTWPLIQHVGSAGRTDNGDGRISIWNVAWVARAMVRDPMHVFDANIFYPHKGTLAYSETNLGAGVLAIPVYWATRNPYAAHNFVLLLSFVLSAAGTYYLVRYLTHDRRAAAVAAACYAFCPYVFAHTPHIQLLMTAGLPFSMLAFHRLSDDPTAARGAALGLTMAAQALFCGYYAVFVTLMVGFAVLLVAVMRHRLADARYWTAIAVGALVAVALAFPLFLPYLRLQQVSGFHRSLDEARPWSAGWSTYLSSSSPVHVRLLPAAGTSNEVLFPGIVAVAFGLAGVLTGWSGGRPGQRRGRENALLYGSMGALAFWTSFGPAGGLYGPLYAVLPVFSLLHAPSRFGIVVVLALAVLTGISVSALLGRVRFGTALGIALLGVTLVELRVPLTFAPALPVEQAYQVLASLPYGAVLEMPVFSRRVAFARTQYMLGSTAHWMPLVDAYSDYIPQDFSDNLETLGGFPSPEALAILRRDGVRYAVVHLDLFDPAARSDVAARLERFDRDLVRMNSDDRVRLYEIRPMPR
jgi:hypothetical protein